MKPTRKVLLAAAFAATVAGAVTGASFRGETKEAANLAATCATATWPMIPAACLEGEPGNEVRYVTVDNRIDPDKMQRRFAIAFQ